VHLGIDLSGLAWLKQDQADTDVCTIPGRRAPIPMET